MSTVRLSDAVVPEVFASYMAKNTMNTMAFYNTGVMRSDAELSARLAGGGRTFNAPFWKDLEETESDVASDDPDSHGTPGTLTSGTDIARRQFRTRGWSTANLVSELAGSDPMARISSRVGDYWGKEFDANAVSAVRGVIADNIANDAGDMVTDISIDTGAALAASNLFNAESMMDAAQTMGDEKQALKLVVMHSVVHTRLAKNDLIDYRPDSEGKVWHSYYQNYRVHVSDRAPVIAGTNKTMYHTYLFGDGAIGWGESAPAKPVEVDSVPSAGDGAGVETLWTRRQFAIHPYGVKWTDTTVAGEFPTNAELRLAGNWDRVYTQRKMIPIAVLISNG